MLEKLYTSLNRNPFFPPNFRGAKRAGTSPRPAGPRHHRGPNGRDNSGGSVRGWSHFSDISLFRHNFCRKSETLLVTLFRHLVFPKSHFSDNFSNSTRIIYIHQNPEQLNCGRMRVSSTQKIVKSMARFILDVIR